MHAPAPPTWQALTGTDFSFEGAKGFYRGKVRDVYDFGDRLAIVATDRISAFDVILPRAIPYKGQALNQLAAAQLAETEAIVPNWALSVPHPNVTVGLKARPYPVEMVIRGYLTGHAWRQYRKGVRELCGVGMPDGLVENDPFPEPIITPATKAEHGAHDEDISREEIIRRGLVPEAEYAQLESYTRRLYAHGVEAARQKGLILVDTKYEFGRADGKVLLIDEVHTPDSSRYFVAEGYEERQRKGEAQRHLSKEFARQWLIAHGFQGLEGQTLPDLPDGFVQAVSQRYLELFERFTGNKLTQNSYTNISEELYEAIRQAVAS